ncbi:hypothetical protein BDP81DRAFT_417495 [Colletotrichum phormii]|uniref:Uncharacterized protein n=1 Tax=Colletotrichum phormii TaxID=359342 RepID=A0AAJ0EJA2_9PEZI|nr:uncharacterized protein BDP81DRAFT_417495 [Colletotrichum phormii]KAK1640824.1 hypothetical protein BDP81DRAFT_417495 [Colletotrichum phormii]
MVVLRIPRRVSVVSLMLSSVRTQWHKVRCYRAGWADGNSEETREGVENLPCFRASPRRWSLETYRKRNIRWF